MLRLCLLLFFGAMLVNRAQCQVTGIPVRWCVYTADEEAKCKELITQVAALGYTRHQLTCVRQTDALECMNAIGKVNPTASLMRLDAGLAYYAAQLYTMRPVLAENYGTANQGGPARSISYPAAVLVRAGSAVTLANMKSMKLCSSGVGTSEGWTVPLARLIQQTRTIPVQQCNSVVLTVAEYFSNMCLPGAMNSLFNNFGSNPDKACSICRDLGDGSKYCKFSDNFAGSDGALRCMAQQKADVAFLRLDEMLSYVNDTGIDAAQFELLCADGSRQPVADGGCHWGSVPSALVVASIRETAETVQEYRIFLKWMSNAFGAGSTLSTYRVFSSAAYPTRNLMFSDQTQLLYDSADDSSPSKGDLRSIYNWLGAAYLDLHDQTNYCPLNDIRWCVLSTNELAKCERMKLAFSAKSLKPSINCVQGESAVRCMQYIQMGLADVINLDAADLYVAGKRFGLVPFVAEYYGDSTDYYAVAIVRQNDKQILVSNLLHKRTCHSGIGKATGWVVPLNLVMDTRQITVLQCRLIHAFSELVSRSCIPGIMDPDYNPAGYNPINLCENCRSGGPDKCQRNDRELYYGDDGAFRCLVEEAGDVAFARHTTVFDNTAGHNPSHWARNRRSNDFEILCADGSRRQVQDWQDCHLGRIPGNTLVTGGYKTEEQKRTMWQLLKFAQTFYASDRNANNFQLFDSGFDRSDLMFQDIAQSLVYIPQANQSYRSWLGDQFMQRLETIQWQSCGYHSGLGTAGTVRTAAAAASLPAAAAALSLSLYVSLSHYC